jgi:hypothetical protein
MNKQEIEKAIGTIQNDISQFKKLLIEQPNSPVRERIKSEISAYEIAVKSLTEQLTNGWIPVSERLPNTNDDYLLYGYYHGNKNERIYVTRIYPFNTTRQRFEILDDRVIAWQPLPLPESYKEVSHD